MIATLWLSIFFVVLPGLTCYLLFHIRKRLSCMAGMMGAMTVGMITGLGIGSAVAVLSPMNAFYSTIIGMMAGALLGSIAGLPLSLMAVLDGLLSGLMAGMMGAMLADMIPSEYHMVFLRFFSIITGGVIFILHLMLLNEFKQDYRLKLPMLFRTPAWMFIFVLLGGVGLSQSQASISNVYPNGSSNQQHMKHEGHVAEELLPQNQTTQNPIRILATEYTYFPNQIQIRTNESVQVVLKNTGTMEHDFEIPNTNIHIHVQSGSQSVGTIQLTKPGFYQAICTIPGHKEAGMTFRIQVI
jgi:uncharacterized cupredoxin-like copper-binding protein